MPTDKGSSDSGGGSKEKGEGGKAARPPWIKNTPEPLPVATMPWTLNKRNSLKDVSDNESSKLVVPPLRKVKKPEPQENGTSKKEAFTKPQLKPVPPKEVQLQSKEVKIPIPKLNSVKDRELPPLKRNSIKEDITGDIDKAMPATRNALVRQESLRKIPAGIPVAPPLPPPAPALPKNENLSDKQREKLTLLRSRPKVRPDWSAMLKEVEGDRKLKHVECNDRSKPLIPSVKTKGSFVFESEKLNPHNDLLKQIEQGIKLKRVKTNDRSKPVLEGLRKFRRQMTIEEQIIKSQSMASMPPVGVVRDPTKQNLDTTVLQEDLGDESDEMDDIDKVRDDLQSTKQLLAFEMRNKEAQIRENKKLLAKIQQLEAELEKQMQNTGSNGSEDDAVVTTAGSGLTTSPADEKMIKSLKTEVEEARKTGEELEKKYTQAAEELDSKKMELEESKKQNRELEKKLLELTQGKRQSIAGSGKTPSQDEEEEEFVLSESESDGEDTEEKRERRAQREIKMFKNKLRSYKTKEDNAKKERIALKEQMKAHQLGIKEEKKRYKALQKEVDKMAALMKESSESEEDDEDAEEEESEKEEEEEEESESETESSDSESESSGSETESEKSLSEAEDAPTDKIKDNLSTRSKRHENMLAALRKGNLMLKANVERLQDDLNKQKELTAALQEDLDSVLAELG